MRYTLEKSHLYIVRKNRLSRNDTEKCIPPFYVHWLFEERPWGTLQSYIRILKNQSSNAAQLKLRIS